MHNRNLALAIVDDLNRSREARTLHPREMEEGFYRTARATVSTPIDARDKERRNT